MWHIYMALVRLFSSLVYDTSVVKTTEGEVRGFISTSRSGRQYFSFTGIPYARPPIDAFRFKPPQLPKQWSGVKKATEDGPRCIQYNMFSVKPQVKGLEDCLYLSIFTHEVILSSKPVLVHIPDGGFISGDQAFTSPKFLMDEDVVVVSFNYRVGIMGFLSFEDEEQPGNQGMKDQVMALKWIQKNIAKFGGDPNKVTLMGDSAGAASATHHILSPLSRGLFHGAIAESGSSYSTWAIMPPGLAKTRVKQLAELVNCTLNSTKEAVTCFQGIDAVELVGKLENFRVWQIDPLMSLFQPVLEPAGPEAFLSGRMSEWKHNPVPLLTGITSGEGLLRTGFFLEFDMNFKTYNDKFEELAPLSLQYMESASNPDRVTRQIKQFYFDDKEITKEDYAKIIELYGDSWFAVGVLDAANKHTGHVYFYYFDYKEENRKVCSQDIPFVSGVTHVEESKYIMCYKKKYKGFNEQDEQMSKDLVKIWTDFATYGKGIIPMDTGKSDLLSYFLSYISPKEFQIWKRWTAKTNHYLLISNSGFKMKTGLYEDRYRFWCNLNYKDKYE